MTLSGSFTASHSEGSGYVYQAPAALINGVWTSGSTSGTLTNDSMDATSYNGTGSYSEPGNDCTISGTASESGGDDANTTFVTNGKLVNGNWVTTGGMGYAVDANHQNWSFSGSGQYSWDQITGLQLVGAYMVNGSVQENGHDNFSYNAQVVSSLGSNGQVTTSGSASQVHDQLDKYSFSGSGSVSQTPSGSDLDSFDSSTTQSGSGSSWNITSSSATVAGSGWAWGPATVSSGSSSTSSYNFTANQTLRTQGPGVWAVNQTNETTSLTSGSAGTSGSAAYHWGTWGVANGSPYDYEINTHDMYNDPVGGGNHASGSFTYAFDGTVYASGGYDEANYPCPGYSTPYSTPQGVGAYYFAGIVVGDGDWPTASGADTAPGVANPLGTAGGPYANAAGPAFQQIAAAPAFPSFPQPTGGGSSLLNIFLNVCPVVGNGLRSYNSFQAGNWGWGTFYAGMTVLDLFIVKSLATSVGKLAIEGLGELGGEAAAEEAEEAGEVFGTAQGPNRAFALNEAGPRDVEEAIELARSNGVHIGEEVRFRVLDDDLFDQLNGSTVDARWGSTVSGNYYTPVYWADLLENDALQVTLRSSVLNSDQQILAVVAHEMHEVNAMRSILGEGSGKGGQARLLTCGSDL